LGTQFFIAYNKAKAQREFKSKQDKIKRKIKNIFLRRCA